MSLNGNWLDFLILAILLFCVVEGFQKGFLRLAAELFSFLGSLFLAIRFYPLAANLLMVNFAFPRGLANALGFFLIAILAETLLGTLVWWVVRRVPPKWSQLLLNRILGIIPAILNGLVLIAFFLTLIVVLPVAPFLKKDVLASRIGGYLVGQTIGLEHKFNEIFGGAVQEALTFLTVKPESRERIDLHFKTQEFSPDEASESKMFALVNEERSKAGLATLKWDPRLVPVARAHSKDMFSRGYFSHVSPEGQDVGDRLHQADVEFLVAGENLAYAPNVTISHTGLMNSPGHRANILSPEYSRVGIGVIDGGIYGKMFTQIFIN